MSGRKVLLDLAHRAGVVALLAGTAYGTCFVGYGVMELRRAGQAAAKIEAEEDRTKAP